jgi:hypothetical protein
LKVALRSRGAATWHDHLPWEMLGVRATFREDSEFSRAEAVLRSQLVLLGQFVATAELPSFLCRRSADHHCGPPATADATQHGPISDISTGGVPTGPLRPSLSGRYTAATGPCHRRSIPGVRAVNTFLSPADRQENGQGLHSLTQAGQDTGGYRAGTAAMQGTPRCAAPPVRVAPPPQQPRGWPQQVTFTLQPTMPPSATSTSSSGQPLRNIRPRTQLNL